MVTLEEAPALRPFSNCGIPMVVTHSETGPPSFAWASTAAGGLSLFERHLHVLHTGSQPYTIVFASPVATLADFASHPFAFRISVDSNTDPRGNRRRLCDGIAVSHQNCVTCGDPDLDAYSIAQHCVTARPPATLAPGRPRLWRGALRRACLFAGFFRVRFDNVAAPQEMQAGLAAQWPPRRRRQTASNAWWSDFWGRSARLTAYHARRLAPRHGTRPLSMLSTLSMMMCPSVSMVKSATPRGRLKNELIAKQSRVVELR
jgi:hypothetical protein